MLYDCFVNKLDFNRLKMFWIRQADSESPRTITEPERLQLLHSIQLVRHRKRLRRMQSQNFFFRTVYSIAELFERVDYHKEAS